MKVTGADRIPEKDDRRWHDIESTNRLRRIDEQHDAAGLEDAVYLGERPGEIGNVLDDVEGVDLVERRIGKGELLSVHRSKASGHSERYRFRIEIDAGCPRHHPLDAARQEAAPAADLENVIGGAWPEVSVYP